MNYKKIKEDDIHQCVLLFQQCFLQEPWNEEWTYEQVSNRITEILSSPYSFGYACYDDCQLVGMMCGRILTFLDYKELWVDDFCVSSTFQGKGIGSLFLTEVKNELKKQNVTRISLNTTKGFLSDKFYKKNGFKEIDSIVHMSCEI